MSVYEETEDVDQGNRVLLFCVGADVQRRRDGANTAVKTRAILQLGGSKVSAPPLPITAVILSSEASAAPASTRGCLTPSPGCRVR